MTEPKRSLAVPSASRALVQRSDVAVEIERRKQASRAREEASIKEADQRSAPKMRVSVGQDGGNGVRLVEQVRGIVFFQ
jgi:hypothetical protein